MINIFQGKLPNSTFLDNFEANLPARLFTIDLKKGQPGSCDFGFIDESKFTGDISYVPVDSSRGDWTFDVQGYTIGTGSRTAISISVIADTGTAFVFLPQSIVDAYYAAVPGSFFDPAETLYAFPCGSTPPSITFDIGTYKAVLPGSFMESVPTDDNPTSTYFHSPIFFLEKTIAEREKIGSYLITNELLTSFFCRLSGRNPGQPSIQHVHPRLRFPQIPVRRFQSWQRPKHWIRRQTFVKSASSGPGVYRIRIDLMFDWFIFCDQACRTTSVAFLRSLEFLSIIRYQPSLPKRWHKKSTSYDSKSSPIPNQWFEIIHRRGIGSCSCSGKYIM